MTETCDDDTPHVITHVETTPATTSDDHHVAVVHAALAGKGLLPRAHLVDAGYTDSNMLITSAQQYGVEIIGPVAADPSWQARMGTGFRNTAFAIDWAAKRATCPQGHQSRKWHPEQDISGQEVIQIRFAKKTCTTCRVRERCTKAKREPRTVTVRTQTHHAVLQAARQRQRTPEFQEQYALRAGIESTISQGVRGFDLRRSRYIGLARTRLQHILSAVAVNLVRVVTWLADPQPAKRRITPFAALAPTA